MRQIRRRSRKVRLRIGSAIFVSEREAEKLSSGEATRKFDPLHRLDEETLLRGVRSGDDTMTGELLRRYKIKIDLYARREHGNGQGLLAADELRIGGNLVKELAGKGYRTSEVRLSVPGLSKWDFVSELNRKLVRLAKRFRPGTRTFRRYADQYLRKHATQVRSRLVQKARLELDATARLVATGIVRNTLGSTIADDELRQFFDVLQGELVSSSRTEKMGRILKLLRRNPDRGKRPDAVHEANLAESMGMSAQSFSRSKHRLMVMIARNLPPELRGRLVRSN